MRIPGFVRQHPVKVGVGSAVVVALAAWLAFGFFDVHTPIIDKTASEAAPTAPAATTQVLGAGEFIDRSASTSDVAKIVSVGMRRVLRIEDLNTSSGPQSRVYLSSAKPGAPAGEFDDDFVDLRALKGNIGDQNYEIDAGVDLDGYTTVVIWCLRFRTVFGAAGLTA